MSTCQRVSQHVYHTRLMGQCIVEHDTNFYTAFVRILPITLIYRYEISLVVYKLKNNLIKKIDDSPLNRDPQNFVNNIRDNLFCRRSTNLNAVNEYNSLPDSI